jgi:hypothetical protein
MWLPTRGPVLKRLIQPSDKVEQFSKRLYNAVCKQKLEEVYGMSGQQDGLNEKHFKARATVHTSNASKAQAQRNSCLNVS